VSARKQKGKRGRPLKWKSPAPEEGNGQPQRVRSGNLNDNRVGHYEGPLREVLDSAREALVVYLLTEDAFPTDEVLRNDQRHGEESERPRSAIKWKKRVDEFFNTALEKNLDAMALGKSFVDLMLCSAEGVYTKIQCLQSHVVSALQYVIHLTDTASSLT
jgi:hypothetical protein